MCSKHDSISEILGLNYACGVCQVSQVLEQGYAPVDLFRYVGKNGALMTIRQMSTTVLYGAITCH